MLVLMKSRIASPELNCEPGDEVELPDVQARALIKIRAAVAIENPFPAVTRQPTEADEADEAFVRECVERNPDAEPMQPRRKARRRAANTAPVIEPK